MIEFLLIVVFLGTTLFVLLGQGPRQRQAIKGVAVGVIAMALWRATVWYACTHEHHQSVQHIADNVPAQSKDDHFVSSQACRACHRKHYESWHRTYHRTMTQAASPDSVFGDFNNVRLTRTKKVRLTRTETRLIREEYLLERRGDEFWSRLISDDKKPENQIVMTTGSHHYQFYWTSPRKDRMLYAFPFVYLRADQRWVPREAVLVTPPGAFQSDVRWNENCIRCHSTHAKPRVTFPQLETHDVVADTSVAELGISCEACHGPAEEHIRANQSPWRRYQFKLAKEKQPDPTIINPKRLSAEQSSHMCGKCHAVATFASHDWQDGHWNRFKVGDRLTQTRTIIQPNHPESLKLVEDYIKNVDPDYLDHRFWSDGMVRVGGREFNGMTESKCYLQEDKRLSCLSCHSMHDSDPNDQLAAGMQGDQACLQCHASFSDDIEEHTHHRADSAGSRCYNCHMPYTTYGLLKSMRSHWIDIPTVASTVATGRPNACNGCHLDKTLSWTQGKLAQWYATPTVELSEDQQTISAALLDAYSGDAGLRALVADALGWDAAKAASGNSWLAPNLAPMLDDPYAAVRYIAVRSLRRLDAYKDFSYDFVGPPDERTKAVGRALEIWNALGETRRKKTGKNVLIDAEGNREQTTIRRLMQNPARKKRVDLQE